MRISEETRKAAEANMQESLGTRRPSTTYVKPEAPAHLAGTDRLAGALMIPLDRIARDPGQPRESFDEEEIGRMAASMSEVGVLMPIRVRWDGEAGTYVIVAGEQRWRAAKIAGLAKAPCVVCQSDRDQVLVEQIVENCRRKDLNPIEKARAFRRMIDATGWSQVHAAGKIGYSESQFSKYLSLLALPDEEQERIRAGESPMRATEPRRKRRRKDEMPMRFKYTTDDASVVVTFGRPLATEAEAREALGSAIEQSRKRTAIGEA